MSTILLTLAESLNQIESNKNEKNKEIAKLKTDVETAKKAVNPSNISSNWVQVIKQDAKMLKNQLTS